MCCSTLSPRAALRARRRARRQALRSCPPPRPRRLTQLVEALVGNRACLLQPAQRQPPRHLQLLQAVPVIESKALAVVIATSVPRAFQNIGHFGVALCSARRHHALREGGVSVRAKSKGATRAHVRSPPNRFSISGQIVRSSR